MSLKPLPDFSSPQPVTRLSMAEAIRIMAMRLYATVGWPGCMGLILLILSCCAWGWLHQLAATDPLAVASSSVTSSISGPATTPMVALLPPDLPHSTDTIPILKRIKSEAQASGLSWPQADYKLTPMSEESLATLEIRTTFKGPYPKLRQLMATLLDKEPAMAMRELSLTRPNGDAIDVEAKIRWAVFLADGWPPAEGTKP